MLAFLLCSICHYKDKVWNLSHTVRSEKKGWRLGLNKWFFGTGIDRNAAGVYLFRRHMSLTPGLGLLFMVTCKPTGLLAFANLFIARFPTLNYNSVKLHQPKILWFFRKRQIKVKSLSSSAKICAKIDPCKFHTFICLGGPNKRSPPNKRTP